MRRWIPALVVACEVLTIATGFVVGYVSVWFQLFGETADREDYLVSTGGYAAGAVAGLVGLATLRRLGLPAWVIVGSASASVLLALLALSSYRNAQTAEEDLPAISPWTDGVGGVLLCPWTWVVVVLGLFALVGRGPGRPARGAAAVRRPGEPPAAR